MADFNTWLSKIDSEYQKFEFHFAEIFQHLHQYPELGGQETETSAYMQKKIAENTSMQKLLQVKNGFIAGYEAAQKPALCLRADLDALEIEEKTTLPYISQVKGIMHACGHDFHSTAVYAVLLLWDKLVGEFPRSPLFLFQHSEEPIPGGALDFLEAKAEALFSEIFGFHVEPRLNTGEIGLVSGWINARSIKFEVDINGPGGHSARPEESVDPVKISAEIIHNLYDRLSRFTDEKKPFVFTVTRINSDNSAYNAIPKVVKWGGTLRLTDEAMEETLTDEIKQTIAEFCKHKDVSYDIRFTAGAPPVINHPESIETTLPVKEFLLGKGQHFNEIRSMGGDDFGWFNKIRPGFMIRIGITPNGSEPLSLHSSHFKVDFKALKPVIVFYLLYFLHRSGLVEENQP